MHVETLKLEEQEIARVIIQVKFWHPLPV